MVTDGFEPRKNWGITGKSFADNIREHCKQLWPDENITREYLGIFARGMFYYSWMIALRTAWVCLDFLQSFLI